VVEAAQHARGVGDALLAAELGPRGIEHADPRALVEGGDLERAAGAGRRLLEHQDDVAAEQARLLAAGALGRLQARAELDQMQDLGGREVRELEEVAAVEIDGHGGAGRSRGVRRAADRWAEV
jgi:hypothetical protein